MVSEGSPPNEAMNPLPSPLRFLATIPLALGFFVATLFSRACSCASRRALRSRCSCAACSRAFWFFSADRCLSLSTSWAFSTQCHVELAFVRLTNALLSKFLPKALKTGGCINELVKLRGVLLFLLLPLFPSFLESCIKCFVFVIPVCFATLTRGDGARVRIVLLAVLVGLVFHRLCNESIRSRCFEVDGP